MLTKYHGKPAPSGNLKTERKTGNHKGHNEQKLQRRPDIVIGAAEAHAAQMNRGREPSDAEAGGP